ncbi:hypothetical protein [Microbacterium sp. HJ5]
MNSRQPVSGPRSVRDRDPLRDEADDFEDDLRAELVRAGVIEEW